MSTPESEIQEQIDALTGPEDGLVRLLREDAPDTHHIKQAIGRGWKSRRTNSLATKVAIATWPPAGVPVPL